MALLSPSVGATMPTEGPLVDRFGRVHNYLRVSVTDRCNFRCTYCMPEQGLDWLPRAELLTYEETARLVGVFARLGVQRVRITGGEPTVRRDIDALVRAVGAIEGVTDLSMTTNAHLFEKRAQLMADAGLTRLNVSLDSVDAAQFKAITRTGDLDRVLRAIQAALDAGLAPIKINAVVMAGVNDDQVLAMVEHFAHEPERIQVRFIEYMPFGSRRHLHVPSADMRAALAAVYTLEPLTAGQGGGPATHVRIRETGQIVGFISPITEHFCDRCNRLRLMADGDLRTCLSRDDTPSLRDVMRAGASEEELEQLVRSMVWGKVAGHSAHHEEGDGFAAFEGVMTRIGG